MTVYLIFFFFLGLFQNRERFREGREIPPSFKEIKIAVGSKHTHLIMVSQYFKDILRSDGERLCPGWAVGRK